MKNRRQSTCGVIATWTSLKLLGRILTFIVALAFTQVALARPDPSPDDAFAAYRLVDGWVRQWSVPAAEPGPKAVGACVTLKYNGEVISRGTAWSATLSGAAAGEPGVLRSAAADAIRNATPKLNIPNDAMRDEALRQIAQDITISVELAGPLSLAEPTTWEDAELTFRPGLDGIGVRIVPTAAGVAPGPLIAVFPSQMLLTNQLPHRALSRAIAEAIGEGGAAAALDDPSKIREKHAMKMYRFRVQHVVQPTPRADAVALYRGQSLLGPSHRLDRVALVRFAHELAMHLVKRSSDPQQPADDRERRVVTFAVGSWRQFNNFELGSEETAVVDFLMKSTSEDAKLRDADGLSWAVLNRAFILPEVRASGRALPEARIRRAMWAAFDPSLLTDAAPEERRIFDLSEMSPARRSIALQALARGLGNNAERTVLQKLRSAYGETVSAQPGSDLLTLSPWVGWADLEIAEASERVLRESSLPMSTIAFRQMRSDCWQHQIGVASATDDTLDMIGGIVFTKGLGQGGAGGGNPYPTWQCVRPLAFIATMLGDKRLTEPAERPGEIARLMLALRFLRQLQVDEASAWMYDNPSAVLGGIRVSTWDNTVSTDATALTLLCVVETLKSLDAIAAEQAQQPAPAPVSAPSGVAPKSPAPTPK